MRGKISSVMLILASTIFFLTQQAPAQTQADRDKAQASYKQGLEQVEASKFQEAYDSFRNAWQLDKGNWDYKWRFMVISSYMGQQALFKGNHAKALELFNGALSVKREITKEEDFEFITIKRFIDLTEEHQKYYPVKPEYTYKIQVLYIMNTDVKNTFDKKNQSITCKGSIPKVLPDNMVRYHEMLRIYLETLSRGRLSISFDTQKVDATVTRVLELYGYSPDFDSIQPSLSPLYFAGRNTYDTILFYWYSGKLPCTIHATWDGGVILVPYAWRSSAMRGRIVLHSGEGGTQIDHISNIGHHWIAFHEYFHHIEYLCGNIAPQHAHLPEEFPKARKNFPQWIPETHKSGATLEYSWYKYHIRETAPARMEQLSRETGIKPPWRNMSYVNRFPDTTDERLFRSYSAIMEKVSMLDRQKAADLVDEGFRLTWSGKNREAEEKFEQALKHNPYHHAALDQLGWLAIASRNNDFIRADRYYTEMARVFPDPKKCFGAGAVFFERNQPARAIPYFRIAAGRADALPGYTVWLARALAASGDAKGASAETARISDHPIMKAPLAVIESRTLDLTLLTTGSSPDAEDSMWLSKLWRPIPDRARWRLVPARDGVHVRIVSNLHWRCLDARGDRIVLDPINENLSQEWKMATLPDGQRRFISKSSGLTLAILPASGKQGPILSLQKAGESKHQAWAVETFDPLIGIADSMAPAWFVSVSSGMAVAIKGGDRSNGAPVIQWTRENGAHFQWKIIPVGTDGSLILLSALSGKCLTAIEKDGAYSIQSRELTRKADQLWRIDRGKDGTIRLIHTGSGLALQPDLQDKYGITLGVVEDTAPQWWKIEY
ncbi:MAG: RICIN domain-containing protein [Spirochaetes bacterium]|nr:RICIN domain-containing protein [Spirochaetota bacterium]